MDQHALDPGVDITKRKFNYLAYNTHGEATLFDNPEIHTKFNVPKHFSAVVDAGKKVHMHYHAWEVTPKFYADSKQVLARHLQTAPKVTPQQTSVPTPPTAAVKVV